MKLCGAIIGSFLGYAIISRIKTPRSFSKSDFVCVIIFAILVGLLVTGLLSLIAPAFAPTTDYDYSFNIYSADPTSKVFILEEYGDTYTYKRKTVDGFKSESIPTNISHVNYSTDGTAKVVVNATKFHDTDRWKKRGFLFFENEWTPTIRVDKYVITIPEGSIVR